MNKDTICAIATPMGTGGVGIIRISGENSAEITSRFFVSAKNIAVTQFESAKMYFGRVDTGRFSDSCLCVLFRAPHSFTGENVVELHCHGGMALLSGILKAIIDGGARLAECGEFTKRAFLNGKLDLAECEGLIDVINAESEAAVIAASSLSGGELSRRIIALQNGLKELLAYIEVSIDYSDEDIPLKNKQEMIETLENTKNALSLLSESYGRGSLIKEGVTVALCGSPNVGKSSLFNALLGYDRAIVTDIAGTTRDSIEGKYSYNGVLFNVIDTAGIREGGGIVEKKGIELAKEYIQNSDIVLFLAESENLSDEEVAVLKLIAYKKHIKVLSKADKGGRKKDFDIALSALTGENVENLKRLIYDMLIGKVYSGGLILTNFRHYDAITRAEGIISETLNGIQTMFTDMLAYNIRNAWETLGEITGESGIESVIDSIFSRFCLGK